MVHPPIYESDSTVILHSVTGLGTTTTVSQMTQIIKAEKGFRNHLIHLPHFTKRALSLRKVMYLAHKAKSYFTADPKGELRSPEPQSGALSTV